MLYQHLTMTSSQLASKMSLVTRSGSLLYARIVQPCSMCQMKRRDRPTWTQTGVRNFTRYTAARTPLSQFDMFSNSLYTVQQYTTQHSHKHGNLSLLQNRNNLPSFHASILVRSFGVEMSSTTNVDNLYIPTPTEKCYELLEYIRDSAGMPWWLTILATTILFRGAIVFPFAVWQQIIFARIENAQPMINAYVEQIKQQLAILAKEKGWSQRKMAKVFSSEVRMLVSNVHFRNKCSPHKLAYLPFWQAGVWVSMTTAIGQMTGKHPDLFSTELDIDVLPALASEGFLWFSDLMQTDFAIAVLLGLVNVTLVELWGLRRGPLTRTQHYLQNAFRLAAISSFPAAAMMPSAVSFYWLASSLCGLGQLALLRSPPFRRLVGIPHSPSEMKRPVEEMKTALKAKYAKKAF